MSGWANHIELTSSTGRNSTYEDNLLQRNVKNNFLMVVSHFEKIFGTFF